MHTQLPKASEKWWLNHEDMEWVGPNSQENWKKTKNKSKKPRKLQLIAPNRSDAKANNRWR